MAYYPDTATLADLADAAYTPADDGVDGYSLVDDSDYNNQLYVASYLNGSSLVLTFRGTNLTVPTTPGSSDFSTDVKNILDDTSFITGSPTQALLSALDDAVDYVNNERIDHPISSIALTGHSLGGAIAQMIGEYADYHTEVFDAPGAGALYQNDQVQDVLSGLLSNYSDGVNTDYRSSNDMVSLVGTPLGDTVTYGTATPSYLNAIQAHQEIFTQVHDGTSSSSGYESFILPPIATPLESTIEADGESLLLFQVSGIVAAADYFFDPPGGTEYSIVDKSSSPLIDKIGFPTESGVASYLIMDETSNLASHADPGTLIDIDPTDKLDIIPLDSDGNQVSVSDPIIFDVQFSGPGDASFTLATTPPCFCTGTRIAAERGEIAVESLVVGDYVSTAFGASRPVRWIGHRRLDLTQHLDPTAVWPVRVAAGAFGEGQPSRDLWMSPGHNLFIGGALIAVKRLINGATIIQVPLDVVTYWHVELDSHDVILAEGLPAESYLDTGNRTAFANGGEFMDLHPDFEPKHWAETCAPMVKAGPEVGRAKAVLLARAQRMGYRTTTASDLHIAADGRRIEPIKVGEKRVAFYLPAACRTVALTSRTFVPAHVKALSTDDRVLGVAVRQLRVDGTLLDLQMMEAPGWHEPEERLGQIRRWTSGLALLPPGARLVTVDLASDGCYWIERKESVLALTA